MPGQFFHVATYGRQARPGEPPTATIAGTLREAGRVPGAIAHIKNPLPPRYFCGSRPESIIDEATHVSEVGRDMSGRHIRNDGGILVAGVISYPVKRSSVEADQVECKKCDAWFDTTASWLQSFFGKELRSAVAHLDEEYPHIHFFLIARLRSDNRLDWAGIHPGLEAKRMSWLHDELTKTQDARYRVAMRELQDTFHESVSAQFGHDRYGPKRRRVSRIEAVSQQALARDRELALAEIEHQKEELRLKARTLEGWIAQIKDHVDEAITKVTPKNRSVTQNLIIDRLRISLHDADWTVPDIFGEPFAPVP